MKKGIKGIYLIERIETFPCEKKYYVGQAIDIFRRLNDHCTQNNLELTMPSQSWVLTNFLLESLK
jgi:predicted GIY-YIG superfamily endonuclease